MEEKALIMDIQRMSTEDGPGLRTTVFFKGCNLRCAWCHNPESISHRKQIEWFSSRCIGCRTCDVSCQRKGLALSEKGMRIDRGKCILCENCVRECPGNAMAVKGIEWQLDDLVKEVIKDESYFGADGGITASGGEPLVQSEFVSAFFKRVKARGLHTALDTAGCVNWEVFERVLPQTALVLLDLKFFDNKLHKRFTGVGNELILRNAVHIGEHIRKNGSPELWVRTPVIPDATGSAENIRSIGRFIDAHLLDVITRWELCSYNNLCKDKYERLDMAWGFKDAELMPKQDMEELCAIARKCLRDPSIVTWSGATRLEGL